MRHCVKGHCLCKRLQCTYTLKHLAPTCIQGSKSTPTEISNVAVQVALEEMKCQPSGSMKNYQEAYQPKSFHSSNHKVSDAATRLFIRCRLAVWWCTSVYHTTGGLLCIPQTRTDTAWGCCHDYMPQNKPQSEHAVLSTLSEHSPVFDSLVVWQQLHRYESW